MRDCGVRSSAVNDNGIPMRFHILCSWCGHQALVAADQPYEFACAECDNPRPRVAIVKGR